MSGTVWADTNRDQIRQSAEVVKAGVTVELVRPNGTVAATTTTAANGGYSFADVPDGDYRVVVTAPGAFRFPATASGDNDFTRQGVPLPGQPERGQSTQITIDGATQATGLDAGLQPIADLVIQPLPVTDGCDNLVSTGTEPFDDSDGGGKDSSAGNCLVRTDDDTTQQYAVSLTGLPTGTQVDNVVVDFTISSEDGARFRFNGPLGGLPTGCLTAGVNPPSRIVNNPDGSVTLQCNMGSFTSTVKPIQIPIRALTASLEGSHFQVTAQARAADGDAGTSNTVVGPDIQVTGAPQWDLRKGIYNNSNTTPSTATINGVQRVGYIFNYYITLNSLATKGNTQLESPLSFVDRHSFPTVVMLNCRPSNAQDGVAYNSPGSITCPPQGTAHGPDGFPMTINTFGSSAGLYVFVVSMFVPLEDAYRAIDPDWQQGDPIPTGDIPASNEVTDTEGWTDPNGTPNNGTGFEPGWDGQDASGNNVVQNAPMQVRPPTPGIPGSGKAYFSRLGGCCAPEANAGEQTGARVRLNTDAQTSITNAMVCDVFDVSVWRLDAAGGAPAGYVLEYAVGPNEDDLQAGPIDPNTQRYPFDTTPLRAAAAGCNTHAGPWSPTPAATFGPDWQDTVNMVRIRPIDPATVMGPSSSLQLTMYMTARSTYNGGPHAGEKIPEGVMFPNEGGWTDPTSPANWSTNEALLRFRPMLVGIGKSAPQSQYLPGDAVVWTINSNVLAGETGGTIHQVVITDTLPPELQFDFTCTQQQLPAGVTMSYNPATRVVTFNLGDRPIGATLPSPLPSVRVCTVVSPLTRPGTNLVNRAQITSPDSSNAPTTTASILINGTGELAIEKSVDHPLVKPGQEFTWSLRWGNTSPQLAFLAPDVIDVLAWNGDAAAGSLSKRDQYASDFTGTHGITGPLAQPAYTPGSTQTGPVNGTWYYSTADPSTIDDDPRAASNANPEAPGGTWLTEAEVAAGPGFAAVTSVRFVSGDNLMAGSGVLATITETATPATVNGLAVLNGVYVNRAHIFSATFPNQPLRSNEPYVLMPGWSMGDLVFADNDHTGLFNSTNTGMAGIPIEVINESGTVIGTTTTRPDGRWVLEGFPEGTYRARVPASAFQPGGPLERYHVATDGSDPDPALGETLANKNTEAADPAATGLVSSPITFSYVLDSDGYPTGGNQPSSGANDPANISNDFVPVGFKNLNLDLAVRPTPGISLVKSADRTTAERAGDVVVYSFLVTNTGATQLTNITVTDTFTPPAGPGLVITCPVTTLAPDESTTCTASYVVTQADADHGRIDNSAVAEGTPPVGDPVATSPSPWTVTIPPDPRISLVKTGDRATAESVGDVINYSYEVTNTGNVTLTDVNVTDTVAIPAAPVTVTCPQTTLAPGESMTCTASNTVSQADVDKGQIDNVAIARGTPPAGPSVESPPDDWTVVIPRAPAITLVKTGDREIAEQAGDVVVYSYLVTNTGNVTLFGVNVTDTFTPPAGPASEVTCPRTTLLPGESTTCTASYTVTQADVDHTRIDNTAIAQGTPTVGPSVESPPDNWVVATEFRPDMTLVKQADSTQPRHVGEVINYTMTVTNTGNVTLRQISVADTFTPPAGPELIVTCPQTTLAPGESMTCVASPYTVTQADVDHGEIVNAARARALPPCEEGYRTTATSRQQPGCTPIITPDSTVRVPTLRGVLADTGSTALRIAAAGGLLTIFGVVLAYTARRRRSCDT